MTTLHIGTRRLDALLDLLPGITVLSDGDSWEEWGESLLEDQPMHVMILADDADDGLRALAMVLKQVPDLLVPMDHQHQLGVLACITPDDDWSEPIFNLIDIQYQRSTR